MKPIVNHLRGLAALVLAGSASAQICYTNDHQCFSFAPDSQAAGSFGQSALQLVSDRLTVSGDIRLRVRVAETETSHAYNANDQMATRARVRMKFQATEQASAFVEFNFSETWGGSAPYSDALVGNNFNGVSQAYADIDDMLGLGDHWRFGRTEYTLSNGLVLGSCDYLQMPATFTGVWVSKNIEGHDIEAFVLDDYGPLQFQAANPGAGATRYVGATASINFGCAPDTQESVDPETGELDESNDAGSILESVRPYVLVGSRDGDRPTEDVWVGVDASGHAPLDIDWRLEWALRQVDQGEDVMAFRAHLDKSLHLCDGVIDGASYTFTDAEGSMQINPADFNSAGLLHQYGGAWRSDLQTHQLSVATQPGAGIDLDISALSLDRRGSSPQQGEFEVDIVAGKFMKSGVHLAVGYGIDDDRRQVGFFQASLFF